MHFLSEIFAEPSIVSTLLYLCLASFLGILIGKVRFLHIKLGVAGVLFTGIILGHCGAVFDHDILVFVRDFGLILFVYSIGSDMGPRFFTSFKKDGLTLNLLALGIVLAGFGIAFLIYSLTGLPSEIVAGIMCGAVTNTPGLGAAQQVLTDMGIGADAAATGYAIAYPFGVIGLILAMLLVRWIFRIKVDEEEKNYSKSLGGRDTKLESVEITITNPNITGQKISYIREAVDAELAISRIYRNGNYILAEEDEILQAGDVLYGVSARNCIRDLQIKIGPVVIGERKEIEGMLGIHNILLTNRKLAGKTIEQVGIYRRYPANITRIYRSGMEILPTLKTTIELGDTLKVVGKREILNDVKNELGDSVKELAIPNIVPIFMGIFVGIILGCIPFAIPGLPAPAKLGIAGGPLVVSILLGYKGRIGKLSFYMTPGANLILREMGIILFLASVGLIAGKTFWDTLTNGGWIWLAYGAAITFVPVMLATIIARLLKINYLKICGCVAGAMTDPPALEFANGIAPVQAQSTAYATVYPLTMFLRVMLAQVFVLMTM